MITDRPDINQVLSQMRDLKSQVQAPNSGLDSPAQVPGQSVDGVERPDFADMLKTAVDNVNALQKESTSLAQAYERGEEGVDLPQVMIGLQKSSVSFEAMTQVRNKLVDAYEKIMNMPI
ncbi:flagellar hook-basal body complex protein FliE [Marinomonas piezotolerans]|uniref:Flagellar hook-basal body complex protein FliE n=1 Tax=Marinomonas piezotolerans TaxID=2213058 RepID=A0A370U7B1_9GAMM|nr:flagellar hook-basal body complex protein FliE [Marinomonas piezotolerans]RDL43661.1 flagellar hook-basal body complex protein FliE [Marinomonas piezotolerans]